MLHICGTAHNDPLGPDRVKKVIKHYKPDIVTVECPDENIGFFHEVYEILQAYSLEQLWYQMLNIFPAEQMKRMHPDTISLYFRNMGYEIALPQILDEFVVGVDVPFEYISSFENFFTCRQKNKIGHREMEEFALSPKNYQRYVDNYFYHSAEGAIDTMDIVLRNKYMAYGIMETLSLGSVVHFSGVGHVHGPRPTLVDLLDNYNPTCSRLKDW